jgi:restriction system protein
MAVKDIQELLKGLAPSKKSAAKTLYASFQILSHNSPEMPRKELLEKIEETVIFEEWEKERYSSNGQLKWLTIFLFYTINAVKTGWLVKNKGIWQLTESGLDAAKLSPLQLIEKAGKGYKEWQNIEESQSILSKGEDINIEDEQVQSATLENLQAQASEGIGIYLESIKFEKFQKICATLLKGMGLYIDFEAISGPDGGIDIIAFKGSLGFEKPRIKVQVKNYNSKNKVDVKDIRELKGLLNQNEHIGVFITSGYFTSKAKEFARSSDVHIKLIDRDMFIDLWQSNYYKLSETEKSLLPLNPIYFLGNLG